MAESPPELDASPAIGSLGTPSADSDSVHVAALPDTADKPQDRSGPQLAPSRLAALVSRRSGRRPPSHAAPDTGHRTKRRAASPLWVVPTALLLFAALFLTTQSYRLPFVGPAIGFWFLVIFPAYLLFTTNIWRAAPPLERIGYSVASVLLILMLAGLAINTALPPLGLRRPLSPIPIAVLGDILNLSLYLLRQRRPPVDRWRPSLRAVRAPELRIVTAAAATPALAVLGANRLNNGAGDQVALLALVWIAVTIGVLILVRRQLRDPAIGSVIFFVSLALLLMTSLRGWVLAGHDIQTEYRVFQLTEVNARWSFSLLPNAYNACMSLTILPTEIARAVNVQSAYVYRFFYQVLFALCPVLAYTIFRRYASKSISVLAAVYFIGFPTFFGDMPYLTRQEIACIFICCGILLISNPYWPQRWRRIALIAAAAGVELSHYSSMYLFLGMLVAAWVAMTLVRVLRRLTLVPVLHRLTLAPVLRRFSARRDDATAHQQWPVTRRTVGLGTLVGVVAVVGIWGGVVTHTAGSVVTDVGQAVSQLSSATGTPYSFLSGGTLSPRELLGQYHGQALQQNARASPEIYLPVKTVAKYATPLAPVTDMPLTTAGRVLSRVGVPVTLLNTAVRQGAADGEELFIAIGFLTILISRKLRRRVSAELLALCAGALAMVGAFIVFPNLSSDFGVLRAFQEALILAAPILVIGSLAAFSRLGAKWAWRISVVICMTIFTSTIGLMPQILGGYPAQLSLNNSGQDYDLFYPHPEEVAAAAWLTGKPGVSPDGLQVALGGTTATPYFYAAIAATSGNPGTDGIYPVLIRRTAWVVAGYSVLHGDIAPLPVDGEVITYRYPLGLLRTSKNLVYDNGGADVYK